ncbi:hypothetical protein GCM10009735_62420 [Actinomadura chokoriensis]
MIKALKPYDREVSPEDLAVTLGQAINEASDALRTRDAEDPCVPDMGTTLAALLWSGKRVVSANIGDSRIYHLRDNQFTAFSEDHVYERLVFDAAAVPDHPPSSVVSLTDGQTADRPT